MGSGREMATEARLRVLRYWAYFRRGHSVYLAFATSLLNFIVIQYRLLVQNITLLRTLLPRLWMFLVVFVATYLPLATLIGWIDYQRGSVPTDSALSAKASPWIQDLFTALMLMSEGKNEEARKILAKWVKTKQKT